MSLVIQLCGFTPAVSSVRSGFQAFINVAELRMSDEYRLLLIEEIRRKLDEFLESDDISAEKKTEILRELLEIAVTEH